MICMENREEAFETAVAIGMNYYTSLQMHWLDNIPKPAELPRVARARSPSRRSSSSRRPPRSAWSSWAIPTTAPRPSSGGRTSAPTSCASARRRPTWTRTRSSSRWSCSAKRCCPQFDKDPVHSTTRYRRGRGVHARRLTVDPPGRPQTHRRRAGTGERRALHRTRSTSPTSGRRSSTASRDRDAPWSAATGG